MIVSCPSCGTLYRHEAQGAPRLARCSCCDGPVHLGARRSYAIRTRFAGDAGVRAFAAGAPGLVASAARAAGVRLTTAVEPDAVPSAGVRRVGMDDPMLAPALEATVFDTPSSLPLRWAALASEATASPAPDEEAADFPSESSPPTGSSWIRAGFIGMSMGSLSGLGLSAMIGGPVAAWWGGGAVAGAAIAWGASQWAFRKR